ncbi:MAG: hypothetical protein PF961_14310 [Planctomycetota bacterium]|jgi:hypothetical protein|nr:hypothetical protein [Planctomycetota bacterium]
MRILSCSLLIAAAAAGYAADSTGVTRLAVKMVSPDYDMDIGGLYDFEGEWDDAYMIEATILGTLETYGLWSATSGVGIVYGSYNEQHIEDDGGEVDMEGLGLRWFIGPSMGSGAFRCEVLPVLGIGWYNLTLGGNNTDPMWELGGIANATFAFGGGWEFGVNGGATYREAKFRNWYVDTPTGRINDINVKFSQLAIEYGASIGYRF